MKIDPRAAEAILRAAAADEDASQAWVGKIEKFSRLCEDGLSKTHIAFLATSILAKATDARADLFAIKPKLDPNNVYAYSARTLSEKVIVPLAAELGIDIGVTGRQPLNNQPYFRMTKLGDNTPVHPGGRAGFNYMVELIHELDALEDEDEAKAALAAFIKVRRAYQRSYAAGPGDLAVTPAQLSTTIAAFVSENSEGGRRAQAVYAGLMDVVFGPDCVESGRINDPSRKYPGDVCIRSVSDPDEFIKAIEVRDKPVALSDVHIFGKKCVDMGVLDASVAMLSENQAKLDEEGVTEWAASFGLGMTLVMGWTDICSQALYWSELPKPQAAVAAAGHIRDRLVEVEVSEVGLELWDKMILG